MEKKMAKKKTTINQEPQLEESWEKFQAALEACKDFFGILDIKAAPGFLWLYIIADELPIPRGVYPLDEKFIIYGADVPPGEKLEGDIPIEKLRPIMQDDGAPATLYQLILDVASSGQLSPDQMAAVKAGVIDPLQEDGSIITMEQILQRTAFSPIKNFIMPRNKLHNKLLLLPLQILDGVPTNDQYTLLMQGKKGAHQVTSYVALRYVGEAPGRGGKLKLNAYDVQLYDAITSLYIHSKKERPNAPVMITLQNIWACMNGGKGRATQSQLERLAKSWDRFTNTKIYLDASDEIRSYGIKTPEAELFIDGYEDMLIAAPSAIHFRTERGAKVKGYIIEHEPILYRYSALRGELLTIPIELLDTSDKVSNTEDVIAFRSYIIRNIALMRQGDRDNHFMRLETIYKETGIEPPADRIKGKSYADPQREIRKQSKKDRDNIAGILESLKGKGYILGYEERKDPTSGAVTGYHVELDQALIEEAKAKRKERRR